MPPFARSCSLALAALLAASAPAAASGPGAALPTATLNDNRAPAGRLSDGVWRVDLTATESWWRPQADLRPAVRIKAFGESGAAPSVPAPLIRVPAGTVIVATVRNRLDAPLRIAGLCERGGAPCAPLEVPPGMTAERRFAADVPGTYHYWATTTGMPQTFRAADDAQLSGAFVVDDPTAPPSDDRVLVITEWTSLTAAQLGQILAQDDPGKAFLAIRPEVLFTINGGAWPHTERLRYRVHEPVRWRVINLTTQAHPMHLHGFYFTVLGVGDGATDRTFAPDQRPEVVTHIVPPAATLTMAWTPERAGNWLFHCHIMTHVSPVLRVDGSLREDAAAHAGHHEGAGMTGMVLGVTVEGPEEHAAPAAAPPRALTLVMKSEPGRFGDAAALGFVLAGAAGATAPVPVPGPTLVLTRGEAVEITLVNRLAEATAIHWHGMELESYYDGVHGWGGTALRSTPMIAPGDSFVVRFTPPRTGTFMYHTHLHDNRQLTSGLYGAMLVLAPGETFDEATDHVLVLGRGGPGADAPVVINNERQPQMAWKAGVRHRVRLINITPDDIVSVSLQTRDGVPAWQPLTKDGAPVPAGRSQPTPAMQQIAAGETYDFAFDAPPGRRNLWFEVRSPAGKWHAQGHIILR